MAAPTHGGSITSAHNATTPKTAATTGTRVVGELVVVLVVSASGNGNTYSVTDNLGHTYTQVAIQNAAGRHASIWYTIVTTGGSLTTSVAATGGTAFGTVTSWAAPPGGSAIAFDAADSFNGSVSSTSHPCAGVGAIDTAANVIIYSAAAGGTFTSTTAPSGYTGNGNPLANRAVTFRLESASALTDERATFTSSSSVDHQGAVASFKAVSSGYTLAVTAASVTITPTAVTLKYGHAIPVSVASVTTSATAVVLRAERRLPVTAGAVAVTPTAVTLKTGRTLPVTAASVTATPTAVGLRAGRVLVVKSDAHVDLSVVDVTLTTTRRLAVTVAGVVVTGSNVGLNYSGSGDKTVSVQSAAVTLSPTAVGLRADRRLREDGETSVSLPISMVGLLYGRRLDAGGANVTLTGSNVGLDYSGSGDKTLTVQTAAVNVAGGEVEPRVDRVLSASGASVSVDGDNVTLVYSGIVLPTGSLCGNAGMRPCLNAKVGLLPSFSGRPGLKGC